MNHKAVAFKLAQIIIWMGCLGVACPQVAAKDIRVDSLIQAASAMPSDTGHIRQLIHISNELRSVAPDASLQVCLRAIQIAEAADDQPLIAITYTSLGGILRVQSKYDEAIEALLHAYDAFRATDDLNGLAQTDVNIASIYLTQPNHAQAKKYLLDAQPIVERENFEGIKGSLYMNLAIVYTADSAFDQATELYQKCIAIYTADGDQRSLALTYANLGDVNLAKGDYQASLAYSLKSFETFRRLGYRYEQALILLNILRAQCKLQDYTGAAAQIDALLQLANETGSAEVRALAWETVSTVREGQGLYALALAAFKNFYQIHDSLYSETQQNKLSEIESQIAVTKRDAEIDRMKSAKRLDIERAIGQARWFWALAIGLGVALILLVLLILALLTRSRINRSLQESNQLIEAHNQAIAAQNEALRQQNERLEDLYREKNGLIGIVAHDLKSPLNKAGGLADLIASSGPLTPAQAQAVEMLRKVASTGSDLIRDLLDLNAIEHADSGIRLVDIDLPAFLGDLLHSFAGSAQHKAIGLHLNCPAGLHLVSDRSDLGRILENLLSNALKFSPQGKEIWLRATATAQHVRITVEDQGPGISEADQAKLFKKFQRLSARPTGGESSTGLGLAITQTLVQGLGGEIVVDSQVGQGSRFTVVLPAGTTAA
jgi:signal transduction histidine kinase